MELSRNLLESLSKEKIRHTGKIGKPSTAQVRSFLEQFKNNPKVIMKYNELLQLACSTVQVMESAGWDQLCRDEQVTMQCTCVCIHTCDIDCYIVFIYIIPDNTA